MRCLNLFLLGLALVVADKAWACKGLSAAELADSLPNRTETFTTWEATQDATAAAKAELEQLLAESKVPYEAAGTPYLVDQMRVKVPWALKDQYVAGVVTESDGVVTRFAGKVVRIERRKGDDPFYYGVVKAEGKPGIKVPLTLLDQLFLIGRNEFTRDNNYKIDRGKKIVLDEEGYLIAEETYGNRLAQQLKASKAKWVKAGEETLYGTLPENPQNLKGKVVAGLQTIDGAIVEVFLGRVTHMRRLPQTEPGLTSWTMTVSGQEKVIVRVPGATQLHYIE